LIVIVALCFSGVMRGQQAQTGAAVSTSQGKDAAATMAAGTSDQRGFVGDNACRACHQREFESYQTTRHHLDSALPSAETIHGHFDSGRNTMTSLDPGVSFRMNTKGRAFYETSFRRRTWSSESPHGKD